MPLPDVPPNINQPSTSIQAKPSASPKRTQSQTSPAQTSPAKMTQTYGIPSHWKSVSDYDGPLKSLSIPYEWKETIDGDSSQTASMYATSAYYTPLQHTDVKLSIGSPQMIDAQFLKIFHELLLKKNSGGAPQDLTWAEINSLGPIVGNIGNAKACNLRHMNIRNLNGVPVLFFEGCFRSSGTGTVGITFDFDGKGAPRDIFLQATEDPHAPEAEDKENLYARYLPVAMQAFKSIIWKPGYAAQFSATTKPGEEDKE